MVDFIIKAVNSQSTIALNMTKDELIGFGINQLFPVNLTEGYFDRYIEVFETGKPFEREFEVPIGFKSPGWYSQQVLRTNSGIVIYMLDISKDKERISALEVNKKQLQKTIDELNYHKLALSEHSIVTITDVQGTIVHVNEKFQKVSGYKEVELVGQNHRIVQSGFHDIEFYKKMFKVIGRGKVWRSEFKNKAKDGTYFWLDMTIVPFTEKKTEKPIRYISISTDITAIKSYEKLLSEANLRFEKALEASKDAIWDWDMEKDEIYYGLGYEEIFGFSHHDKSKAATSIERLHPEDRIRVTEKLNQSIADPETETWGDSYRMKKANGKYVIIEDRAMIVRDNTGKATRMIGSAADITERTEHIESIEAQNKKLRQIAWLQSHYLRAPLANSKGLLDILQDGMGESSTQNRALGALKKSLEHLDQIIHEIVETAESIK